MVLARDNRKDIANWATEDRHCWRDFRVGVCDVTTLKNCSLHSISIQVALSAIVVSDESFHCLHSNFARQ